MNEIGAPDCWPTGGPSLAFGFECSAHDGKATRVGILNNSVRSDDLMKDTPGVAVMARSHSR